MTAFHLHDEVLEAYDAQRVGSVERASTEAHLLACAPCRASFAAVHRRRASASAAGDDPASAVDLDGVWDRVLRTVEDEPEGRPAGALRRLGVRDPDVVVLRSVAAGAAQWTLAAAVVVATAALAAGFGGITRSWLAFVVLAPLWPPLGVAATYRFGGRSLATFERTSPYPPARLLLWRTAYVVATAVPLTMGFGALIGGRGWLWASWLLPSVACTLAVVIAATWVDPLRPAIAVAVTWTAAVLVWSGTDGSTPFTSQASVQVACAVAAVGAAVVLDRRLRHLRTAARAMAVVR